MTNKNRIGILDSVLYLVWLLTHYAYKLQTVISTHLTFWFKCIKSRLLQSPKEEFMGFLETVSQLEKVPKNLAILVQPNMNGSIFKKVWPSFSSDKNTDKHGDPPCTFVVDKIHLRQVAKVVAWATAAGIPVISVYDYYGGLKSKFRDLEGYVQVELSAYFKKPDICKDMKLCDSFARTEPPVVKFHNQQQSQSFKNGTAISDQTTVHVFAYSSKDGIPALIDTAHKICLTKHNNNKNTQISNKNSDMHESKIDEASVDEYLQQGIGWPSSLTKYSSDPDLIMILGSIKSTLGFLPWQIRLSEMHWLPSLQQVQLCDFVDSLKKYSACQQRCGK